MKRREHWLSEGVSAAFLDELERFAPLDSWDLSFESGEWIVRVKCPGCGAGSDCAEGAVEDFYCDDCEYDIHDDARNPIPMTPYEEMLR